MIVPAVVVLLNHSIKQVSYACPKFAFQVSCNGHKCCRWNFEGVISILWIDFMSLWFRAKLATIFN